MSVKLSEFVANVESSLEQMKKILEKHPDAEVKGDFDEGGYSEGCKSCEVMTLDVHDWTEDLEEDETPSIGVTAYFVFED